MRSKISLHGIGLFLLAVISAALSGCGSGILPTSSFSPVGSIPTGTGSSPTTNPPSTSPATPPAAGPTTGATSPPPATTPPPVTSPSTGTTTPPPTTTPPLATVPTTPTPPTIPVTPPAVVSGNVYSGQNRPVTGAKVSLYAVGSSGYGLGSKSLLSTGSIVTDSGGRFVITGAYTCPSADAEVYLVAIGGDAGAGANASAVMMSAPGECGKISASPLVVNEITTVASVYALAQFMVPGSTAVGSSTTNRMGMVNGFRTANNLYDSTTGRLRATTPAGNGTIPQSKINSLANVLADCIESPSGSSACSTLFQAATAGAIVPQDTLTSILNIALHPALNLKTLSLSGPYQPSLAGLPSDWTLSIEYTGGGLNYGQLIAADGSGNIWVPNAVNPGTLSEFNPVGEPLSGPSGFKGGGLSYPQAVAVDQGGNVWTANAGNNSVSKHNTSGVALSGSGYTTSGLKLPYALAIDGSGNVFTANGDNTVTKLSSSGAAAGQFQQGGLDFPYSVAVDRSENVWVANYGYGNDVSKFSNAGTASAANGYTGGGVTGAVGIAIDGGGNAWVASFDRPVVSKLNASGSPLSGSGYAIPAGAASIMVDGDNTVWTANSDGSVSRFSNDGAAISPPTGFVSNGATAEVGIAIDPSGNVWTSDNYVNSIFEYIGAAAPTVVPLQVAVKNNQLGKRP